MLNYIKGLFFTPPKKKLTFEEAVAEVKSLHSKMQDKELYLKEISDYTNSATELKLTKEELETYIRCKCAIQKALWKR